VGGKVTRGWGSYFYNPNGTRNVLLEAPHIRFDTHSYDVASVAFSQSDATGLLFNGAHRNSGGINNADVAHLSSSIFHTVHQAWTTDASVQTWQIHGFNLGNAAHASIPAGTDVVLSNGNGLVSQEIINLNTALESVNFIGDTQSITHAFNTLNVNAPPNVTVNGIVPGADMKSLGGTTNRQGIYTRSLGGTFVHIELEQSIRLDQNLSDDFLNRKTAGLEFASVVNSAPTSLPPSLTHQQ